MFLKKLNINKNQLLSLGIATFIIFIIIILLMVFISFNLNDKSADLNFLGYKFVQNDKNILIATPQDGQFTIKLEEKEENKELTKHEQHNNENSIFQLKKTLHDAYSLFYLLLRNATILIYLIVVTIIMWRNKETYFQGIFKGFIIGIALLLFLNIIVNYIEFSSNLISFEHELLHTLN